jgi:hypothetical protein
LARDGAVRGGSPGNGAELKERKAFPAEVTHRNARGRQSYNEAIAETSAAQQSPH